MKNGDPCISADAFPLRSIVLAVRPARGAIRFSPLGVLRRKYSDLGSWNDGVSRAVSGIRDARSETNLSVSRELHAAFLYRCGAMLDARWSEGRIAGLRVEINGYRTAGSRSRL